jgi:hypothetical protein
MDTQQRQGPGLPISGGAVVIALIVGVLFVQQSAFRGSRPRVPGHGVRPPVGTEDVQARLWEDPFAAVRRHRKDIEHDRHDIDSLAKQIIEKASENEVEEVIVLGVMVFGGPYAENAERRIRSRHATLSALGVLGYVPENAEHLGYIEIRQDENNGIEEWLPEFVPYEWFVQKSESKPKRTILLLWLDDDAFHPTPLAKIGKLKSSLEGRVKAPCETHDNFKKPRITFKILGPAGSTNLLAMANEILSKKESNYGLDVLKGVQIFSTSATAAEDLLFKKSEDYSNVADLFKPVTFLRTIGTDKVLTDALVDELARRGADPLDDKNHVVLISEWDTFYGRALPRTFIRSVNQGNEENKIDWIHQFSYLRGIDGQLPGASNSDASGAVSSGDKNKDMERKAVERPEGRRQFDYLRRLATKVEHLNEEIKQRKNGRIKAIGVLGSDIYDKLLVLQAMRDRFRGAIFFTTDLDANLLHPEEFKWTHNLVIASSFGLELHKYLQNDIPPFRDNYQTSLFFSTMIALDSNVEALEQGEIREWLRPRIFEVSRSGAYNLSIDHENGKKEICLDVLSSPLESIHPPRPSLWPSWKTVRAVVFAFLLAVLFLSLYTRHYGFCRAKTIILSPPLYFAAFALFGALVLVVLIYAQGYDGEPFALFEGVSLWPTEFLRFFSGMLSAYFLYSGCRKLQASDDELSSFFDPKPIPSGRKDEGPGDGPVDAVSLWETYCQLSDPKRRFFRVITLGILYFFFCFCIIQIFGNPFVPYRGGISFLVDKIVLLAFAVFPMIVLIFGVVDATKLGVWLIRRLSEKNTAWPEATTRHFAKALNIDPRYVNEYIYIRVIAKHSEVVGRLIYYPFLVMIVMLVSRIRYFDNWDLPLGLLIVILLGMAYAAYCAVILRRSAEQARRKAMKRLWKQETHAKGQGDEAKHVAEQITLILGSIRSTRQGAFLPFFQQPLVQALALFFGGGGSLLLLEYLSWMK